MLHIPKLPPTYITKSPPPPLLQAYMHARGMTSSLALSAYKESQLLFPARHINLTTAVNRVYNYSEKKSKLLGTFFVESGGKVIIKMESNAFRTLRRAHKPTDQPTINFMFTDIHRLFHYIFHKQNPLTEHTQQQYIHAYRWIMVL